MNSTRAISSSIARAALALLLVLALAPPAWAGTDVVVLVNRDQITGTIKVLTRGRLEVDTDDLGTVQIEWDKVATIRSTSRFDVEIRNGQRMVGSLGSPAAGQTGVGIVTDDGTIVTVPFLDVVALTTIGTNFWRRIDGSIDLGASYSESNGVGQASFDLATVYRRPSFETSTRFSTLLTQNPDSPDTAQYHLIVDYTRYREPRWFTKPLLLIEHNPDLGFSLRTTGAMTVGQTIVHSNRVKVEGSGGFSAGKELPADESASSTNVDAVGAFSASLYTYDHPKTTFDLALLVFPSLKEAGRVRLNFNVKMRRELLKDFFAAVTSFDAFDSKPSQEGAKKNDVSFTLSLGWTF